MAHLEGYRLRIAGDRLKELLGRQFIVPTLASAPTPDTKSWLDGSYTTAFRIGELCRVKENSEWVFYRLQDINNGKYVWVKANASELPDMGNYYTKQEVDEKITKSEGGVVKLTQEEYDKLTETGEILDNAIYFVEVDGQPTSLYVGAILIAQKEEGSQGFTYNFPIIF